MKKVGFIGCGNMGSAIIKQLSTHREYTINVYDTLPELANTVASDNNVGVKESLKELLDSSTIIILAVKPQVLPSLYTQLSKYNDLYFISIAAGVTIHTLESELNNKNVVRLMPNMASSIGKSVTAFASSPSCNSQFVEEATHIAKSFGEVHLLDESLFAPFIGISGSGIAMMFSLFHSMALGAVHQGLNYNSALSIICDTAMSAGALIKESKEHPSSLITKVCSPKGTTIEMMKALSDGAFESVVMDGVIGAAEKSEYLEAQQTNKVRR